MVRLRRGESRDAHEYSLGGSGLTGFVVLLGSVRRRGRRIVEFGFFEFAIERLAIDLKDGGGLALVTVDRSEDGPYILTFEAVEAEAPIDGLRDGQPGRSGGAGNSGRQISNPELAVAADEDRGLYNVVQFAHVAGPSIAHQARPRFGFDLGYGLASLGAGAREKVLQ